MIQRTCTRGVRSIVSMQMSTLRVSIKYRNAMVSLCERKLRIELQKYIQSKIQCPPDKKPSQVMK
jgi:hypothetical protein